VLSFGNLEFDQIVQYSKASRSNVSDEQTAITCQIIRSVENSSAQLMVLQENAVVDQIHNPSAFV
jgi:hypothetical protein